MEVDRAKCVCLRTNRARSLNFVVILCWKGNADRAFCVIKARREVWDCADESDECVHTFCQPGCGVCMCWIFHPAQDLFSVSSQPNNSSHEALTGAALGSLISPTRHHLHCSLHYLSPLKYCQLNRQIKYQLCLADNEILHSFPRKLTWKKPGTGICTACFPTFSNKWALCDTTGGRQACFLVLTGVTKVRNTQVTPQEPHKGWEDGADGRFLTAFHLASFSPTRNTNGAAVPRRGDLEISHQKWDWINPLNPDLQRGDEQWEFFSSGHSEEPRGRISGDEKISFLLMLLRRSMWRCFGLFTHDPLQEGHSWHYTIPWWLW